jgi:hypothetical protein
MAKTICKLLGVVFLLVGVAGFAKMDLLGTHLSLVHNAVHIVSGIIALYLGFAGSLSGAKTFCLVFGVVYLLLGVCGFVLGKEEASTMAGMTAMDKNMWVVLKGQLELGRMDHIVHLLLGVVFIAGGLMTKSETTSTSD